MACYQSSWLGFNWDFVCTFSSFSWLILVLDIWWLTLSMDTTWLMNTSGNEYANANKNITIHITGDVLKFIHNTVFLWHELGEEFPSVPHQLLLWKLQVPTIPADWMITQLLGSTQSTTLRRKWVCLCLCFMMKPQLLIQLWESQIIANGQTQTSKGAVYCDDVLPWKV